MEIASNKVKLVKYKMFFEKSIWVVSTFAEVVWQVEGFYLLIAQDIVINVWDFPRGELNVWSLNESLLNFVSKLSVITFGCESLYDQFPLLDVIGLQDFGILINLFSPFSLNRNLIL